tara:strand:+ start:597 stop:1625 length:1029 start_codon:yes stop_codon:yes gene_type:complete
METSKYIYALLIICILGLGTCQAQFFKYATFYTSMSMNTSMVENEDFRAINKGYEETTQINPYDYNFTIGIRKIARFDFEQKIKNWYIGDEQSVSDYTTIGNNSGWEYLLNYSFIRNRSEKFTNQDFWIRYLGNNGVTKIQIKNDEARDLKFTSFDTRHRINKGRWDFTIGVVGRTHPVYGYNPIADTWESGEQSFFDLAEDFGYSSQFVNGRFHWFKNGQLLATSNDEFFKHYFGSAIAEYNRNEINALGNVYELSAVLGMSYYKYSNDFWFLSWANVMPYHYGLNEYSYEYEQLPIDIDLGLVTGWKITKSLGIFIEGTYLRYWEKPIYECKLGFNYLIF